MAVFQCAGCLKDIVIDAPVPKTGQMACPDPACDGGIDFDHAYRHAPEAWDLDDGYAAYCSGQKIPRDAHAEFVSGWWAANDAHERFGEHESFLFAPDYGYYEEN